MGRFAWANALEDGALWILGCGNPETNGTCPQQTCRDRPIFQRQLVPAVFCLHTVAQEVVRTAESPWGRAVGGGLGLPMPRGKSNKALSTAHAMVVYVA
jgi:hypothetical protein